MKRSIILGAALVTAGAVQAAVVVGWDSTAALTGDSDVSTAGTSVYAYNLGAADTYTVNTVTFAGTGGGGIADLNSDGNVLINPTDSGGNAGFSDQAGDYGLMLDSASWMPAAGATITLGNLTDGQEYQIQVWSSDTRNGNTRNNTVVLDSGAAGEFTSLDVAFGTYVMGTFTADATGQAAFTIDYTSNGNANINAIQLRAIPEPATLGLIGFIGTGLIFIRRRFMI